jgi:hypothetical protein
MHPELNTWLHVVLGKPAAWLYRFWKERIAVRLNPWLGAVDEWISDKIDASRRASREMGVGLGKIEIVIVAFLLVQITPVAAGLGAAALCTFSALMTSPLLLFGMAPLCSDPGLSGHLLTLASTALASLVLWVLLRWSLAVVNDIQASRAKVYTAPKRPTRALIMGLSEWPEGRDGKPGGVAAAAEEAARWAGRWQDFVVPGVSGGNWQQSLRRIAASIDTLEVIYVLPSTESSRQFDAFIAYARLIFGRDDMPIQQVTDVDGQPFGTTSSAGLALDYEDYDAVSEGLQRALVLAGGAVKELARSETCVDITAGQKVFSIAGGVLTLNGGLMFSYVTTQPREQAGHVKYYDAELIFPDRLHSMVDKIRG